MSHRYWRVQLGYSGSTAFALKNIGFCTTAGGANIATGGTASATQTFTGTNIASCFANTGIWSSTNAAPTQFIEYDFGSGNAVSLAEVFMTSRNDANFAQAPIEFVVQFSDDNVSWTSVAHCIKDGWTQNQTVRFTFSTSNQNASHQWWGVEIVASVSGAGYSLPEMFYAATNGGSSLCVGGTARASENFSGTFNAPKAFDGNPATRWSGNDKQAQQSLTYELASTSVVAQISMSADATVFTQTPNDFILIFSDDGLTWGYGTEFTSTTWSASQTQLFSVPGGGSTETGTITTHLGGTVQSMTGARLEGGTVTSHLGSFKQAMLGSSSHTGAITSHLAGLGQVMAATDLTVEGGTTRFWTFGG